MSRCWVFYRSVATRHHYQEHSRYLTLPAYLKRSSMAPSPTVRLVQRYRVGRITSVASGERLPGPFPLTAHRRAAHTLHRLTAARMVTMEHGLRLVGYSVRHNCKTPSLLPCR